MRPFAYVNKFVYVSKFAYTYANSDSHEQIYWFIFTVLYTHLLSKADDDDNLKTEGKHA